MSALSKRFFYIVSLSANTLIYKGMLTASQIETMFPDLTDADLQSALALVHQRFSTNTFPSWPLAHPYRYIAHNGRIYTTKPFTAQPFTGRPSTPANKATAAPEPTGPDHAPQKA